MLPRLIGNGLGSFPGHTGQGPAHQPHVSHRTQIIRTGPPGSCHPAQTLRENLPGPDRGTRGPGPGPGPQPRSWGPGLGPGKEPRATAKLIEDQRAASGATVSQGAAQPSFSITSSETE